MSPAQSRVARLVTDAPAVIAFGSIAAVAHEADTSPQTVLRFVARVGHSGYSSFQAEVRDAFIAQLPPAAARIRHAPAGDLVSEVTGADEYNVASALAVDRGVVDAAVGALAEAPQIGVIAAESWLGVGSLFAGQLSQLRPGVAVIDGPVPRVAHQVAVMDPGSVIVALDVRRYERWVLDAVTQAADAGMTIIAASDGPTSPLFARAGLRFVVGVASPGPFESATGIVALLHLLATEAAAYLQAQAQPRLDAAEAAWLARDALID